jgi:chloride channel 3/4/5
LQSRTHSPQPVAPRADTSRISFKRKPKPPSSSSILPRFFNAPSPAPRATPSPRSQSRLHHLRNTSSTGPSSSDTNLILSYLSTPADAGLHQADTKDASGLDWYVEGPGRRVGYSDRSAIDWIFEYAKERSRLRNLASSGSGIVGTLRQLADASQVWIILVAAGILSGGIAAFIDVASDWLADLKTGYCSSVEGDGRFYLHRGFCCWGIETGDQCADWQEWGSAMGIGSVGGKWIVEYILFILFSVSAAKCDCDELVLMVARCSLQRVRVCLSESSRRMLSIAVSRRSRLCWVGLSSGIFWAAGRW